jgi:hypothetical protein
MKKTMLITLIIALAFTLALATTTCKEEVAVAPTITTETLPNGGVGVAYSQTLTATGDTPITWNIETGSLPNGLTLSTAGVISGTPTIIGTSSFTVNAANDIGNDTKTLSIGIVDYLQKWTAISDSYFYYITGIVYGNNMFVAGGGSGRMAYSSDGASWRSVSNITFDTTSASRDTITGIAYGNNMFVAVGDRTSGSYPNNTFTGKMAYSNDGVYWGAVSNNPFDTFAISSIAYGNGRFVAGGSDGKMAYSTNGTSWTAVSDSTIWEYTYGGELRTAGINAIAYGNGRFVAVGNGGRMAYSTNGINWTAVSDSKFSTSLISAIAYGNNRFVAGGGSGKMAYSADGITWTAVADSTFGTGQYAAISAIAYGNNRFVAGGYNGKMAYSDNNGVTWTDIEDRTAWSYVSSGNTLYREIRAIAYGNNRFIAGGESGKMAYCYWAGE